MVGMDDEDHLRAACWNLLWALNQRVTHPELDDRFCAKHTAELLEENLVAQSNGSVRIKCLKCGDMHGVYKGTWEHAPHVVDSTMRLLWCPSCGESMIHVAVEEVNADE